MDFGHFKDFISIFCLVTMGKNFSFVIGVCNNDKRFPQHYVKHSNVTGDIIMHALPKDETVRKMWVWQILKRRKDLKS